MGRKRKLPNASKTKNKLSSHADRAAINTPVQGGAADVVMMAMLKIHSNQVLKELGWKLLLQIHDEVILEGPEETVDEALEELKKCMERPFDNYGLNDLQVQLVVDAKSAKSWYEAK